MKHLDAYLNNLGNVDLCQSIKETVERVNQNLDVHFCNNNELTALLLGNVQSGKTGQMLGVMASLADQGYKLFIILTTDNVDLQRQTYNRAKDSLLTFNVLSEKDESLFTPNYLSKPLLLVLKKNQRVLKKWSNLFASSNGMNGLILCIFDDEADAASLNTLVNKKQNSTINSYLKKIKGTAASNIYFQVTATPQAVLLQTGLSGWKPTFITYFKPGKSYLGGNFFYSDPVSFCIKYTDKNELDDISDDGDFLCPKGLSESILSFLVVCAYKRHTGETNCNFLIHPSVSVKVHQKFDSCVKEHLNLLQGSTDSSEFRERVRQVWLDFQRYKPDLPHYEVLYDNLVEILEQTLVYVIQLNSVNNDCRNPNNPDALDLSKGFNIVIGGNTLGRGITFPHLQTVYYCRSSKTPQADTFWQHSRIFGYDRDRELIRIFIPKDLHHLFVSLNESNEMLIGQIEKGIDNLQLVCSGNIRPTRKNVLDNKYLNLIVGGVNMYSSSPVPDYTKELDALVYCYADKQYIDVSPSDLVNALSYTKCESALDFDEKKHIECITALQQKHPSIPCRMIIRVNRNISRGTGTLLSPTDRILGDQFPDGITLTLYRVNGDVERGWSGVPVWVPNIKYPDSLCFYSTTE